MGRPADPKRRKRQRRGAVAVVPDPRRLAWEILQRVDAGGYADALLGHQLPASGLDSRDQALVTRLVYGALAWQGHLDHLIAAFSHRAPAELDAPVRTVLRLGLMQMCVLSKIPEFAAVDTAVRIAKRYRGGATVSFVNAVLRRAAMGWRDVPFPSPADDQVGHLATRLSHPAWLVEHWLADYGAAETEALLRANNEPAPTVVRVNALRGDREALIATLRKAGWTVQPTRYAPTGIVLEQGGGLATLPGFAEGRCSLQGEASQLVGFMTGALPGQRVLDACAAPGGKTTHLAEMMKNQGVVVALDPHARGVERLTAMTRRLGLSIVQPLVADALTWPSPSLDSQLSTVDSSFDCVLVDAPCTGLGTLRAHPEVRWRRTPADVRDLAALQLRLLLHLSALVRPHGVMVYATCTLTAEENEGVVQQFLQRHAEFSIDDPRPLLPENAHELVDDALALRTLPHRHGLDGFYAVRLHRARSAA